jgi:hypothetical protein
MEQSAPSPNLPSLWLGQGLHATSLLALVAAVAISWIYLGAPNPVLFWLAVAIPIAHQIFVWAAWRLELRSSATSRTIGFRGYLIVFFILFGGRFVSLLALAWANRGALDLGFFPQSLIAGSMAAIGIYAMYSVHRYFGLARAAGADHFFEHYRSMPLVNKGIFRFTSNGMYLYAFLLFWAIAVGFNSSGALIVAAFSHAYIWIHFYVTEKPDMDYLYSPS